MLVTALVALVLQGVRAIPSVVVDDPPPDQVSKVVAELAEAHSRIRADHDLPPLKIAPKLVEAAERHARDMAAHGEMTHEGSDGSTPAGRVSATGYHYLEMAENVAFGQKSVEQVMEGWMGSEHHRVNILGDFSEIGAAVVKSPEGRNYWSVSFGRPIPVLDPKAACAEVANLINARRERDGLKPLESDPQLTEAATAAAETFAGRKAFRGEDGGPTNVLGFVQEAGYAFRALSQDFANGQPTPQELLETIAPEPPAKTDGQDEDAPQDDRPDPSIFGDFRDLGVGYAIADDGIPYWVILLAKPLGTP